MQCVRDGRYYNGVQCGCRRLGGSLAGIAKATAGRYSGPVRKNLVLAVLVTLVLAGCSSMDPEYRDFFYGGWGNQNKTEER